MYVVAPKRRGEHSLNALINHEWHGNQSNLQAHIPLLQLHHVKDYGLFIGLHFSPTLRN
jgi:hypothetical protein